jgi:hypothetical protein
MKKQILYLIVAGLAAWGCGDGRRNIRDYYFPALDLQNGKVYAYDMTVNGDTVADYWYYRSFVRDSGLFLSATNYSRHFQIDQMVRERIADDGSVARSYLMFEQDSATSKVIQVPAQLTSNVLFPFRVKDSLGVFLFSVEYHPLDNPSSKIYLIRNRRFLGDGPDFTFNGKIYPCVRMGVREAIGNESEGASEIEGTGEEWYAKGIGLVYYKKSYGIKGQLQREYRLKEIFSMEELEKRAGKAFSDQ